MEENKIAPLIDRYKRMLRNTRPDFKRSLYDNINWNARMIGIKGARGVGKTTLMLQHIKETFNDTDSVLYATLDDLWFQTNTLEDLAQWADQQGLSHLFLDEVHRYNNWAISLKNIYDTYDTLNIVYTGSNLIEIQKHASDLSRRQTMYKMPTMNFGEFLRFNDIRLPELTLEEILTSHAEIASDITSSYKILPWFKAYLRHGYYPFYKDETTDFLSRLQEVVNTVIDVDIPSVANISPATRQKAKTLLMILAENIPTVPRLSTLYQQVETTYDTGLQLINLLEDAEILMLYSDKPKSYKNLTRPDKIFLDNPNLMHALTGKPDIGTARETFFLNQLKRRHVVTMPKAGDFLVDGKYLFEVGGKSKTFDQIADIPDSYLAVDDTEIGHRSRIPLWLFGLLK